MAAPKKPGSNQNTNTTAPQQGQNAFASTLAQAQAQPQTQQGPAQTQAQPQQGPAQGSSRQPRQGSMMDINSIMRRPMSRQSTGEVVAKFQQSLQALMDENYKEGFEREFKLIVLDNNVVNVGPLSSLLLCYNTIHNNRHVVAVHTMLIEASGPRLEPKVEQFSPTKTVTIDTVPGDVFISTSYFNKTREHVKQVYGRDMDVLDAGAVVLPRELESTNFMLLRQVLFNATNACFTTTQFHFDDGDFFSVDLINTKSEMLKSRLSFGENDVERSETNTGLPIRRDVNVTLSGSLINQHDDGFQQTRSIASVDGYVDLVFSPPQAPVQQMGYHPQAPMAGQEYYYPRLVITKMDTQIDANSIELQLLSLAQTTILSRQMNWAGCFRPRDHVKGTDLRDIGAIGYEVPLSGDVNAKPAAVDTKAASFGDAELYQLITQTIRDKLLYSLDIDECGDLGWLQQIFLTAADKFVPEDYNEVIAAADRLTNNMFSQFFFNNQDDTSIAWFDNNRIHLGYYKDEHGEMRDIRDIDYLAMLNLSGKDNLDVVAKWGDTFDNIDVPMEIRLADRAEMIRGILGDNVKFKAYARRITFNPHFIVSLNEACHAAGLIVRPENMIQEFTGGVVRGNFNVDRMGLSGSVANSQALFNNVSNSSFNNRGQSSMASFRGNFSRNRPV